MSSTYYEKLIRTLIHNSEEDTWKEAVEECHSTRGGFCGDQ